MLRILKIGIVVIAAILGLTALSALALRNGIEYRVPTLQKENIILHFIHGSITLKKCSLSRKRLGGLLGGHIEIELGDSVYGFVPGPESVHLIPHSKTNSVFESRSAADWQQYNIGERITSIHLPLSTEMKVQLLEKLQNLKRKNPYDYALFGERCASLTTKILADSGIIGPLSAFEARLAFFYPRAMRKKWLEFAQEQNMKVVFKPGVDCRLWE